MPVCVVIKSTDKPCRNWAMKGKTCCFAHRSLEDKVPEVPVKYEPTHPGYSGRDSKYEPTHPGYSGRDSKSGSD